MTTVNIPLYAKKAIQIRRWVRNARAPVAQVQNMLAELAGYSAFVRSKPVWRSPGAIHAAGASLIPDSQSAERERWHFSMHAGPFCLYLWGHITMARQNDEGGAQDTYAKLSLREGPLASDPVVAVAEIHYGSFAGTPADSPDEFRGGEFLFVEVGNPLQPFEVDPETDYYVTVSEHNYGRIVSAELHEVALNPDTENGYAPVTLADGSPILDEDRRLVVSMGVRTWKRHAMALAHWHADTSPRELAAETPAKNPIDDSSTSVTASTPGMILDLRNRTTLSRAALGVPVELRVYADATDGDGGEFELLDDEGDPVLTVPIGTAGPRWYETRGYLPAELAKYDPRYGGNTLGTLTLYDFTLLELDRLGDPIEGALSQPIGDIGGGGAGDVLVEGELSQSIGAITGGGTGTVTTPTSLTLDLIAYDDSDTPRPVWLYAPEHSEGIGEGIDTKLVYYEIIADVVGTLTDVELVFTLPKVGSTTAGFDIFGSLSEIEDQIEDDNAGWTAAVDDNSGAGPYTITLTRASLTAGEHTLTIRSYTSELMSPWPLGEWKWGTSSSPGGGTVYTSDGVGGLEVTVTGTSNEVSATGYSETGLYVSDVYLDEVTFDPDPGTEDEEVEFTVTTRAYGSTGVFYSVVVQVTDAVTCSEPTVSSNPDGWSVGSWSSPGGGIQWEATITLTTLPGAGAGGPSSVVFATTPSEDGTLAVAVSASVSTNGYEDSNGGNVTVDPAASWNIDATSGTPVPLNNTEWNALMAYHSTGVGPLDHLHLCQETSGDLSATHGGLTLVATNSPLYNQSFPGFARKAVAGDSSTANQRFMSTSGPNAATTDMVQIILMAWWGQSATVRGVCGGNNGIGSTAASSVPRAQYRAGSAAATPTSYAINTAYWMIWMADGTNNRHCLFTRAEKYVSSGYSPTSTTNYGLGGFGVGTFAPVWVAWYGSIVGAGARWSNATAKAVLEALGETVVWTP